MHLRLCGLALGLGGVRPGKKLVSGNVISSYQRITEGAYGYGQQRLQETLGLDDEAIYELDGYMDFEKYGQDCMENDCVAKTEFGLLRRLDPPFPEQTQGQQMFQ